MTTIGMKTTAMTATTMTTATMTTATMTTTTMATITMSTPSPSADLIMLGLATHEPNFTILREEFKPNQPRPCEICGQVGHDMKECTGAEKKMEGEVREGEGV